MVMFEALTDTCWNCDRPKLVCNFKHFIKDIGQGILIGFLIGGSVGFIAAVIHNLLGISI
jgi:uncharacterized membrane protein (Fun14 family)